jgi:hypothetical protein
MEIVASQGTRQRKETTTFMLKGAFNFRTLFGPCLYGLVVALAFLWMFATEQHNAFCALPAIFLTVPWTPIFLGLIHHFAPPHVFDSEVSGNAIICLSAAINMMLLFLWSVALDRSSQ